MKVACTTVYDARCRANYGGNRTYYQLAALEAELEQMYYLGPLNYWPLAPLLVAKRSFYRHIRNRAYHPLRDRLIVQDFARQIARRLRGLDADIVLSPLSPCSQPIAYLDCRQPIVIWTDATWAGVVDFYPDFMSDRICAETLRDAIANERAALSRAAIAIYWSDWAAQCAIRFYGLDPTKVGVIPPGPSLGDLPTAEAVLRAIRTRPTNRCRLLFVGEHWERKGGDTALEIARLLNASGLPTELVLAGARPPAEQPLTKEVTVLGHIDRASRQGDARMRELLAGAHFLVLPSRAEAFGLAFAEASAFGVPSLAPHIGGTPSAIRSGVNGMTFPSSAGPEDYARYIEAHFSNYARYVELAQSSFAESKTRLNNQVAATSLRRLLENLL